MAVATTAQQASRAARNHRRRPDGPRDDGIDWRRGMIDFLDGAGMSKPDRQALDYFTARGSSCTACGGRKDPRFAPRPNS